MRNVIIWRQVLEISSNRFQTTRTRHSTFWNMVVNTHAITDWITFFYRYYQDVIVFKTNQCKSIPLFTTISSLFFKLLTSETQLLLGGNTPYFWLNIYIAIPCSCVIIAYFCVPDLSTNFWTVILNHTVILFK